MYGIPLLLVTGKRPVKYVYTFPVPGFACHIAANNFFLLSLEQKRFSISSDSCSLFVNLFFLVSSKCPKIVAFDFVRYAAKQFAVRFGHVINFPLFTALILYFTVLNHVPCKRLANYAWVLLLLTIVH